MNIKNIIFILLLLIIILLVLNKHKEFFENKIIYSRAKDRNYIYYEPSVAKALNTEVLTSKEIEELRKKKAKENNIYLLNKQITETDLNNNKQSLLNHHYYNNLKNKCNSDNNYCTNISQFNNYCYKNPKKYCAIKNNDKEQYCIESMSDANCPDNKSYNNSLCI